MFNVCHRCGLYRADKLIDSERALAICPECGHAHPFRQLPLLIVSGASGAGKSTVCNALVGKLDGALLLDADILWSDAFNQPDQQYRPFFEQWLRLCKNINQAGRPVVLFGAGCGVPANLERCVERRYFSTIHYLALVCDGEILQERLRQRPDWRESSSQSFIDGQFQFNQWFRNYAASPTLGPTLDRIDTTNAALEATLHQVAGWIQKHIL